ncbi:hypothetical protein [Streptacidiphilus jiangxiensis]|uniref:Uncharacterized protein n=1 Tax=Streptacidiphilus jiangxiensis TaxID=235985 RepID=A0A1H7VW09_STRJI|nr:hypothetical protein [Streptacidiphilus jiangxiensis]SEM13370.1 hypothetical protein SAMN05414137_11936 [Streptacidiphilus jiangxiensis]
MAERMLHRAGVFGSYQGNLYRVLGGRKSVRVTLALIEDGDPVPSDLQPDPNAPGRAFFAGPEQLDSWYRTRWTFRWRDQPFDAVGSSEGRIGGWYAGREWWLIEDHLERMEASAWMGTFPLDEVTDLTEHREDLMAAWKEEHDR